MSVQNFRRIIALEERVKLLEDKVKELTEPVKWIVSDNVVTFYEQDGKTVKKAFELISSVEKGE